MKVRYLTEKTFKSTTFKWWKSASSKTLRTLKKHKQINALFASHQLPRNQDLEALEGTLAPIGIRKNRVRLTRRKITENIRQGAAGRRVNLRKGIGRKSRDLNRL